MTKNYEICLRLSVEEKERLERSARACGLSKTAYLRRLILEKEVKALPSQEIKALRTEVHKIGVNINQIARSVNAGIARYGIRPSPWHSFLGRFPVFSADDHG